MANANWTDALSTGNLATAGNWNGGAIPVTTNDIKIEVGHNDLFGDLSANSPYNSCAITAGFQGRRIGTSTAAMKMGVTNAGAARWTIEGSANLESARLDSGSTVDRLSINGCRDLTILGGTWLELEIGTVGNSIIGGATTLGECRFLSGRHLLDTLTSGGDGPTLLIVGPGAVVTIKRPMDNDTASLVLCAGQIIVEEGGDLGITGSKVFTIDQGYIQNRTDQTLPIIEMLPMSKWDSTLARKNATITKMRQWPMSKFDKYPSGVTNTITTFDPVMAKA